MFFSFTNKKVSKLLTYSPKISTFALFNNITELSLLKCGNYFQQASPKAANIHNRW